jgi:hypothetical protein
MFLCGRVAWVYPQAAAFIFIYFYDTQGYSGCTVTRLHTEYRII